MGTYPYAGRFEVHRTLPGRGRDRDDVLAELRAMAKEEDAFWETGRCSGTMYCGDHAHYDFLNQAFGLFAHVNVLQRDMCPSATRFEGEIIAMALDLMRAGSVTGTTPGGLVTTGGTGSILHAVLAYRERAAAGKGVTRPNLVKPETGHPAFDKACHLFGVELRQAPIDPVSTQVDLGWVADHIDDQTIAIVGSACNYGYGTVDPIEELSALALDREVGLHVDGCLGGFILPFGEELGYPIPAFDFRLPGVTSISADTHKYGYAFKGSSALLFRDKDLRNSQYFFVTDWSGGKYGSPGIEGSRSGGLLAATWAAMVHLGREGYRRHADQIFTTADRMKDARRTADPRPAELLLQLYLGRVRRVSRQRLHAAERLAAERPAVPQRHPHGRDAAADPAWRGRCLDQRSDCRGHLCEEQAGLGRPTVQRRHLRRGGGRDDCRGRWHYPGGHDRHVRRPAEPASDVTDAGR
jgi:sphinganine-1-phosphate aldolase